MTTAIARRGLGVTDYTEMESALRLFARGEPKRIEKIAMQLAVGSGLGYGLHQCLTDVHIIEGRPCIASTAQLALVRERGVRHEWVTTTRAEATLRLHIPGDPTPRDTTWTIQMAVECGLTQKLGNTWKNYPDAMLRARCITTGIRMWCPEFLGITIYDPDEMDMVEPMGRVEQRVESTPRTVPGLGAPRQIEAPPPTVLDAQPAAPTRMEVPEWAAACAGELLSPDQADEVTGLLRAHGVPLAPVAKRHGEPHTWTGATVQAIVGRAAVWLAERAQRGAAQVVARGEPAAEQGGGEE